MHQIPNFKCFLFRLAFVLVQSIEARYYAENEGVVGAVPTGDAPTTSEWSTILLPARVRLTLEVLRYVMTLLHSHIGGLVQDCNISITNALEILLSFTKPWIWTVSSIMAGEPWLESGHG